MDLITPQFKSINNDFYYGREYQLNEANINHAFYF